MNCPHCGTANSPGTPYCVACGTQLGEVPPPDPNVAAGDGEPTGGPVPGAQPFGAPSADATTAMPATTAMGAAGAAGATGAYGAPDAYGATPTTAVGAVGGGGPPTGPGGAPGAGEPPEGGGGRTGWIIGGVVALVLVALGLFFLLRGNDKNGPSLIAGSTLPSSTTTTTSTTTPGTSSTTSTSTTTTSTTTTTSSTTTTAKPTTTTSSSTTTTTAPAPTITSFDVPATVTSSACASQGFTEITISWDTKNAGSVTIGISNPDPYKSGLPPKGSLDVPFNCSSQTYYITAVGANGKNAVESKVAKYTGATP